MGKGKIRLTNKSKRDYITAEGKFYAGTSKEFSEELGVKLLGYTGEIVRTEEAIGDPEFAKLVKEKNQLIADMEKQIAELKKNLAAAKAEAKKLKKPRA